MYFNGLNHSINIVLETKKIPSLSQGDFLINMFYKILMHYQQLRIKYVLSVSDLHHIHS
jgi:hypothetical protein